MKLTIDISSKVYNDVKDGFYDENARQMGIAIGNGNPIQKGQWIKKADEICFTCTNCWSTNPSGIKYNYCPKCGANMIEEHMRDFTSEESESYQKSLDKIYKPIGMNVFDTENEEIHIDKPRGFTLQTDNLGMYKENEE